MRSCNGYVTPCQAWTPRSRFEEARVYNLLELRFGESGNATGSGKKLQHKRDSQVRHRQVAEKEL